MNQIVLGLILGLSVFLGVISTESYRESVRKYEKECEDLDAFLQKANDTVIFKYLWIKHYPLGKLYTYTVAVDYPLYKEIDFNPAILDDRPPQSQGYYDEKWKVKRKGNGLEFIEKVK